MAETRRNADGEEADLFITTDFPINRLVFSFLVPPREAYDTLQPQGKNTLAVHHMFRRGYESNNPAPRGLEAGTGVSETDHATGSRTQVRPRGRVNRNAVSSNDFRTNLAARSRVTGGGFRA